MNEKSSKGRFLTPKKLRQNHSNEGKREEEKERARKSNGCTLSFYNSYFGEPGFITSPPRNSLFFYNSTSQIKSVFAKKDFILLRKRNRFLRFLSNGIVKKYIFSLMSLHFGQISSVSKESVWTPFWLTFMEMAVWPFRAGSLLSPTI